MSAPPLAIRAWSAWAPGLEDAAAWRAWAAAPTAIGGEGSPEARFLPAMLRRRCSPLTRIMLTAAYGCFAEGEGAPAAIDGVRTVFASRHGSINESIDMLRAIAAGERLSPTKFSHTVHNAQAGLFSMAASNRLASSSLAGMEDTLGAGWLEALTHLERDPDGLVLLVVGDVPLAPSFAKLIDEPPWAYGVGLLLARAGDRDADAVTLSFEPAGGAAPARAWPDALELLRFWIAGEPELSLATPRQRWRFTRG